MASDDVVVVSNRGPMSFVRSPDGGLTTVRGAGGLVSSLRPLLEGTGATWVSAAMGEDDRRAAGDGLVETDGFRLRVLDVDPAAYRQAYDVVSNATLWFLHHGLFDLPRRPRIDRHWLRAWEAYRTVNRTFAEAVVAEAPTDARVLVQDYHLALVAPHLAEKRPDLSVVHFSHTPFATPDALRVLPKHVARELLEGMAAATACGFHSRRWASAFESCCEEVLGWTPSTFVAPLAPDADDLTGVAASDACGEELASLEAQVGDRAVVVRVDRIEPSKNILRGFLAFEDLLEQRPEWRERVVFAAFVYPSRESLAEYLAYRQEVETLVARINLTWATPGWTPILIDLTDNFPAAVAGLRRYDVLLVNPVRDGLNLVAKEGPLVNERDGVVALSREAGSFDELAGLALEVNPFDVAGTSDVLADALTLDRTRRRERSSALKQAAIGRTPKHWLEDNLAAIGG